MKKLIYISIIVAPLILLQSCAPTSTITRAVAYPAFYSEPRPLSILVMPPINKTMDVDAKENFYITISKTLCERGYYVVPPFLAMELFQTESAYDAENFIGAPLNQFREVTGADVVLFTVIIDWKKSGLAAVIVTVEYILRSATSNETIFQRTGTITYDTSVNTGAGGLVGLAANVAASAVATAVQSYLPVAAACNDEVLSDIPAGKYRPDFNTDQTLFAGPKTVRKTIKK